MIYMYSFIIDEGSPPTDWKILRSDCGLNRGLRGLEGFFLIRLSCKLVTILLDNLIRVEW
jgi:hypothetical protein